jgi:acetyl esterase/lipase
MTHLAVETLPYPPLPSLTAEDSERRALDLVVPDGPLRNVALFYVHGGGWFAGAREQYHEHLEHFSGRGFVAASAGYRIAEGSIFPDKMADVAAGYALFCQLIADRGLPVDRIVLVGSSAGAHLATMLALQGLSAWTDSSPLIRPTACVSVNGPGTMLGFDGMDDSIRASSEKLVGARYADDPKAEAFTAASPDCHVPADPPDFLFLIVGKERYFPHGYVRALADAVRAAGARAEVVLYPEAEHGFFYRLDGPDQRQALNDMDAFLAPYLTTKPEESSTP